MVGQFGSRDICDVTFKALNAMTIGSKTFKAGQPVFVIDTATTSSMEQGTTTVYAQGGKGYNRLIAWEGEKTMTFNVTDALMSPMGLKILSGAGFKKETDQKHIHVTYDVQATYKAAAGGAKSYFSAEIEHDKLANELGILSTDKILICNDANIKGYGTVLDSNGSIKDWAGEISFIDSSDNVISAGAEWIELASGKQKVNVDASTVVDTYKADGTYTLKLDFYVIMTTGASELTIGPGDFGGNFYIEADTLYRNRSGKDMAATLTFPNVKIQSAFTISMAANGDPSTFDFVMDAFPGYTYFDPTNKVVCDITIVSGDTDKTENVSHAAKTHTEKQSSGT